MWSDDDGPFTGRHYRLEETICSPRPISSPRPPILVGGGGERRTLLLVARYADACNLFASSPEEVAHKLSVLDRHCVAEGRDPASIDRTILVRGNPLVDPDGFMATMARIAALGVSTVHVMPGNDPVAFTTEVVGRIAPRLADLGP
jgi:alkanesulfonate monooxygenase SsuD/methylene tetrahydromethanopterin reductase-like flavin-dependent oxidoreductase (luciferase family)